MLDTETQKKAEFSWKPQPGPQTAFMHCPCEEILYGGARGGGKTFAAIGKLLIMALTYGDKFKGIFFRRELTQLRGVIEETKAIYPKHGAVFVEGKKEWRFPNGAVIYFAHLERDSDAEKYVGWSVQAVVFEEAGNFPNEAVINKIRGILRSTHGVPTKLILTANPGGPGHTWLKARFIDPAPLGFKALTDEVEITDTATGEKKKVPVTRMFIPAKVSDNKLLMENDPMYTARLAETGSPELVRAWLEGDWNVIPNAFFAFSVERHVLQNTKLPSHWLRYRSFDWGSARPFATYWWAVASEDWVSPCGKIVPRGAIVAYREWYGVSYKNNGDLQPNVGIRMFAEDIGKGIAEREAKDGKITFGVIDPAAFTQDGGPSIAERISRGAREVKGRVFWKKADNKRVAGRGAAGGWDALRARLDGFDFSDSIKTPMIFFMENCIHAIRTLPDLQHDEDHPEDIDTDAEDHAADSIRYACMARPWTKPSKPDPERMKGMHDMDFNEALKFLDKQRPSGELRIH